MERGRYAAPPMCTLLLLRRVVEGVPLLLLMNRDELYDRPAEGPALHKNDRSVLAPGDRRAGGTWVGLNDMGLVVAVSNRHEGDYDSARRSRGLLCREALGHASALEVKDFVEEEVAEVAYNPFNLVYADRGRAFVTYHGEEDRTEELAGEIHVMANLDVDQADQPRIRRVRTLLEGVDFSDRMRAVEALQRLAADHEAVGGESVCLHGERAGTVSSTLVGVSEEFPRGSLFLYAAERPCEAAYEDYSSLLEAMVG